MAHPEIILLSQVIEDGNFQVLKDNDVDVTFFATQEGRAVFRLLNKRFHNRATYGTVPSLDVVQHTIRGFRPVATGDDIDMLVEDLLEAKLRNDLMGLSEEITDLVDRDLSDKAVRAIIDASTQLGKSRGASRDINLANSIDLVRERYDLVSDGQGLLGIPFPWDPLNEATLGMQPGQLFIIYGRPGMMKCVCEGERIMGPDGSLLPIERRQLILPSHTESTGRLRWANAKHVRSGLKDCVRATTSSGKQLRTSTEHLYMVPGGYERICNLKPGDWVATARRYPDWVPSCLMEAWQGHFIGILVGDGNYTRNEVQLTNEDREVVEYAQLHAAPYGCRLHQSPSRSIEYRISGTTPGQNRVLDLLRKLGIHGQSSRGKTAPQHIFRSGRPAILGFLAGLLDTDGSVHEAQPRVVWYTSSHQLALDVQHLLLRFDIQARVGHVKTRDAWQVVVTASEQIRRLHKTVGRYICIGRKREALERLAVSEVDSNSNVDVIPRTDQLYRLILDEKARSGKPWPRMGKRRLDRGKLFRRTGCISRALLKRVAQQFDSERLMAVADSDICWEQLTDIEPIDKVMCHDMCIEDGLDPNFVVGDFVVHNTWTAILIAVHAYLSANARVLFYTREMTEVEILMRMAAVIARVDYSKFRKGRLQPAVRDEVFEILYGLQEDEEIIAERDGARRKAIEITTAADLKDGHTVRGLREKALEYNADIVVGDGIYRMGDARTGKHSMEWTNLTHVSQDLKEGAKALKIPIVGVTQANRGNDLAFSDSFLQEADLALRCVLKENELVYINRKLREDQLPAFSINAFPATNFMLKGQLSVDDALALRTADDQAAHRHKPAGAKSGGRQPTGRRLPADSIRR